MFKVGDWVIEPNGKITRLEFNVEPGSYYAEECKLWQPKVGEWCVVANEGVMFGTYTVFQYDKDYDTGYEIMPIEFLLTLKDK